MLVDQTVYTGEKVNFDGSASTASAGSSLVKYEWDFENDGGIDAEGAKTSYTYNVKGQYCGVKGNG
jgi:PKD repeat protein